MATAARARSGSTAASVTAATTRSKARLHARSASPMGARCRTTRWRERSCSTGPRSMMERRTALGMRWTGSGDARRPRSITRRSAALCQVDATRKDRAPASRARRIAAVTLASSAQLAASPHAASTTRRPASRNPKCSRREAAVRLSTSFASPNRKTGRPLIACRASRRPTSGAIASRIVPQTAGSVAAKTASVPRE